MNLRIYFDLPIAFQSDWKPVNGRSEEFFIHTSQQQLSTHSGAAATPAKTQSTDQSACVEAWSRQHTSRQRHSYPTWSMLFSCSQSFIFLICSFLFSLVIVERLRDTLARYSLM